LTQDQRKIQQNIMSNKQQTAVDFLWDLIPKDTRNILEETYGAYTQAKAMHKEQILIAYDMGDGDKRYQPEQYYKETYETDTVGE
jgi:hypothetical protein